MAETLNAALSQVFSEEPLPPRPAFRPAPAGSAQGEPAGPVTPAPGPPVPIDVRPGTTCAELAAQARSLDTRMTRALRDGNLALFGQEWERLRKVLEAMRTAPGCSEPPAAPR
jgi:hypothetical protein